jgi:hypothetical protein
MERKKKEVWKVGIGISWKPRFSYKNPGFHETRMDIYRR